MATFKSAWIKGAKGNFATGAITLTFEVPMDPDEMRMAEELSHYIGTDHNDIVLTVTPVQLPMFEPKETPDQPAEHTD
jgi:hypothetical protein